MDKHRDKRLDGLIGKAVEVVFLMVQPQQAFWVTRQSIAQNMDIGDRIFIIAGRGVLERATSNA